MAAPSRWNAFVMPQAMERSLATPKTSAFLPLIKPMNEPFRGWISGNYSAGAREGQALLGRGGGRPEEIPEEPEPLGGPVALGMELHALEGPGSVAQPHDLAFSGPRRDDELRRQRGLLDNEGVVAHGGERIRQAFVDPGPVVPDLAGLPVHGTPGA